MGLKHSHLILARLVRGGAIVMYAVIETGGKQYKVQEGDIISVEKKLNLKKEIRLIFQKYFLYQKKMDL